VDGSANPVAHFTGCSKVFAGGGKDDDDLRPMLTPGDTINCSVVSEPGAPRSLSAYTVTGFVIFARFKPPITFLADQISLLDVPVIDMGNRHLAQMLRNSMSKGQACPRLDRPAFVECQVAGLEELWPGPQIPDSTDPETDCVVAAGPSQSANCELKIQGFH